VSAPATSKSRLFKPASGQTVSAHLCPVTRLLLPSFILVAKEMEFHMYGGFGFLIALGQIPVALLMSRSRLELPSCIQSQGSLPLGFCTSWYPIDLETVASDSPRSNNSIQGAKVTREPF
jgi:hypothetical protein